MIIGTRKSALALAQSHWVQARLGEHGLSTTLSHIMTKGDALKHLSFDKIEGKGFFTTEVEEALLQRKVDIAVHSLKDLPSESTPGLIIAAVPVREVAYDALLILPHAFDKDRLPWPLCRGARVGSSAVRRQAQLAWTQPDLVPVALRGNVPTRLQKLRDHACDAIILAQAGLARLQLDLTGVVHVPLPATQFVSAPGQGALALQCRANDLVARKALSFLHHPQDAELVTAERTLLRLLNAGCHVPLGAHARRIGQHIDLSVFYGGTTEEIRRFGGLPPPAHSVAGMRGRFRVQGRDARQVAEAAFAAIAGQVHAVHPDAGTGLGASCVGPAAL